MIKIVGDIAMQDRMLMSPELWRRIDKPRMARLISECRSGNPDLFFFFHSDGNVTAIMDDLIEIGFDVINPIQPECMDPVDVKKRWGNKITMHGGLSVQRTLPMGSVEDVRAEVATLIENCGYDGGLVVCPSNVVQPDTPVENIIACYHSARDFDLSKIG
jgi:uroporphyrinogen decarboxylase